MLESRTSEPYPPSGFARLRASSWLSFRLVGFLVVALLIWFAIMLGLRVLGTTSASVKPDAGPVYSVAFSADGGRMVAGTNAEGQKLHMWDASSGLEPVRFTGFGRAAILGVAFSPDGGRVACTRDDWPHQSYDVQLFDVGNGREVRRLSGHTDTITCVAFLPGGRQLLSGSFDKTLRLWDIESGQEVRRFTGHTTEVNCVAVSPDGRQAVSGGGSYEDGRVVDPTIRLWDLASGKEVLRFTGHDGSVKSLAISPDGRRVLSASWDNTIRLWDLKTGKELRRFEAVTLFKSVAFSPDGRYFLSGGLGGRVWLWDAGSGQIIARFEGHTTDVRAVAFAPDGRRIASAGGDHRGRNGRKFGPLDCVDCDVRLWDVQTKKEIARLTQH